MSLRRLVLTATAMGLVAVALTALTPRVGDMTEALTAAQRTADTAGADALVIAAAGLLAWAVWAWGALGLVLTAASALPGLVGSAARLATQVVLPAGARRSAALLLGVGLGVAAPVVTTVTDLGPSAVAAVPAAGVPDWPAAPSPGVSATTAATDPVPDWPGASSAPGDEASHVVVRGDCLWHIAATWLREQSEGPPTDRAIARAVREWWSVNADVIGPDPDRLLPGQLLRAPGPA
jgi:nucleoid-associated protein YgaU